MIIKIIEEPRSTFWANESSPRNGSKIKPANADACRQLKVRKRGKGVKEKRVQGGET